MYKSKSKVKMFVLFAGILNIVEKQPLAYERDLLLLFFLVLMLRLQ